MTNEEILQTLAEIRAIKNPCDRAEALVLLQPKYKKSPFFKKTRKPLQMLYYETLIEDLLSLKTLLHNAQTFINELDTTTLKEGLDSINDDSFSAIMQGIDLFNSSGLADLVKKP